MGSSNGGKLNTYTELWRPALNFKLVNTAFMVYNLEEEVPFKVSWHGVYFFSPKDIF